MPVINRHSRTVARHQYDTRVVSTSELESISSKHCTVNSLHQCAYKAAFTPDTWSRIQVSRTSNLYSYTCRRIQVLSSVYSQIQVDTCSRDDSFVAHTGCKRRQVDTTCIRATCITCKRGIMFLRVLYSNMHGVHLSLLLTPTRVTGVWRSSASVYVCVCVCAFVCVYVRMIEPKRLKLQSQNLPQR